MKTLVFALLILFYSHLFSQFAGKNITNLEENSISEKIFQEKLNEKEKYIIEETLFRTKDNLVELNKTSLSEEYLIAGIVSQNWNGLSWVDRYVSKNVYDEKNNLIEWTREEWDDGVLIERKRGSKIYDIDNNLTEHVFQVWDGSDWKNTNRHVYSYENNNLIETIYQNWDENDWINDRMYLQAYNNKNIVVDYISKKWENNNWTNTAHFTYDYEENNNLVEYLRQKWDTADWINTEYEKYKYDTNNNMIEKNKQVWSYSSEWYNNLMEKKTYDANNNLVELLDMTWNKTNWDSTSMQKYFYDERGNKLEFVFQDYHNSAWRNGQKLLYTYDADNNLIEELYHNWVDSDWDALSKTLYTYDADNNLIEELRQLQWSNSTDWDNMGRDLISYKKVTDVDINIEAVNCYKLFNNYPNPFNPTTVIGYTIPSSVKSNKSKINSQNGLPVSGVGGDGGNVQLKVYDILGKEIATLVNSIQNPGYHEIEFNASNLANGVYFYRLQSGTYVQTKKMILLK